MVLKQIVGATMAVVMAIVTLTMIIPMLVTAKNSVFASLPNQNDTTVATLISLGNNVYLLIVFIVAGACGFVVFLYMSNRDPFEVGGAD